MKWNMIDIKWWIKIIKLHKNFWKPKNRKMWTFEVSRFDQTLKVSFLGAIFLPLVVINVSPWREVEGYKGQLHRDRPAITRSNRSRDVHQRREVLYKAQDMGEAVTAAIVISLRSLMNDHSTSRRQRSQRKRTTNEHVNKDLTNSCSKVRKNKCIQIGYYDYNSNVDKWILTLLYALWPSDVCQ